MQRAIETSDRKNKLVREVIDDWQTIADRIADYLPSFYRYQWSGRQATLTRLAERLEPDDSSLYAHDRNAAAYKVQEAFGSWYDRGCPGDRPVGEFGSSNYLRKCSCCTKPSRHVEIVENDRGFGLRVKVKPRVDPVWFHIRCGEYQREYLDGLVSGDLSYGVAPLRGHLILLSGVHSTVLRETCRELDAV
ncbi:hypothetical protein C446_15298, partial [Halobiforma nitratireducens JCM 10879]